jgi:hypothetical protein
MFFKSSVTRLILGLLDHTTSRLAKLVRLSLEIDNPFARLKY